MTALLATMATLMIVGGIKGLIYEQEKREKSNSIYDGDPTGWVFFTIGSIVIWSMVFVVDL